MRTALVALLCACGDNSSATPSDAPPDAGEPPPRITGFPFGAAACRGGLFLVEGQFLQGARARIEGVELIFAGYTTQPERLHFSIPHGITAGLHDLVVETASGSATSPFFRVLTGHTPEITGSTPSAASQTGLVTLTGTDLKDATVQLRAYLPPMGGTAGQVTSSTDTSLTFSMPVVRPGEYWIQAGAFQDNTSRCGYGRSSADITAL